MQLPLDSSDIKTIIQKAFKGVRLGGGCSLRTAEVADNYGRRVDTDRVAFPDVDVADDWAALSLATLDHYPYPAYMDAQGFRYYIAAFMLSVLSNYEPSSMRVISTLTALSPGRDASWERHRGRYSLLSRDQCAAIALYLLHLPTLVELDEEDQTMTERALQNHWHAYL